MIDAVHTDATTRRQHRFDGAIATLERVLFALSHEKEDEFEKHLQAMMLANDMDRNFEQFDMAMELYENT